MLEVQVIAKGKHEICTQKCKDKTKYRLIFANDLQHEQDVVTAPKIQEK